jgi:prepilin-type N-terminal cleavage/methylation domain-containing protein
MARHLAAHAVPDSGFTLIELLVAIIVSAILLAIAVPSFMRSIDKSRLVGATENLFSEMRMVQTESIKRGQVIEVVFQTSGAADAGGYYATWCYGLRNTAVIASTCNCFDGSNCQIESGASNKFKTSDEYKNLKIKLGVSGNTFSFNPRRGTADSGNVEFKSSYDMLARIVVNPVMRIMPCSPSGSGHIANFPSC